MTKYRRIAPWPAVDFSALDALIAPDRSEGIATLADTTPEPPNATVLVDLAAYQTEKARIRALWDAYTPPPDPFQSEIAWARGVLTASDATWTGATENQFRLQMKRILRLYGRLLSQLREGE